MIIDCIADLHGFYPKLEGGDLLIVAGDLTARDTENQYFDFWNWAERQDYKRIVIVPGNHDGWLEQNGDPLKDQGIFSYLCDSGTEFQGLKIWGSPWTLTFDGINPKCTAFTGDEKLLEGRFALIPDDIDILVTHGPPYGVLDTVYKWGANGHCRVDYTGSSSLRALVWGGRVCPSLHVFGHIHEAHGRIGNTVDPGRTQFVNCSHVNERYEPVNKPIRVIL